MLVQESRVLGIKVHGIDMDESVQTIARYVEERSSHLVVTLGTEMVMAAQQNATFRDAIDKAALVVPDAVGVVWACRRLGLRRVRKVAGIELMSRILEVAEQRGWRVFLLGAAEGVAEEAAQAFRRRWPGLQIVGTQHGYFKDEAPIIERIQQSRADILFLALGSPRQELLYWKYRDRLGVPVGMGVGGSFDVYAGRVRRAPRWMIALGLEWAWRLYLEPSRWRRMLALPQFVFHVLRRERRRSA